MARGGYFAGGDYVPYQLVRFQNLLQHQLKNLENR